MHNSLLRLMAVACAVCSTVAEAKDPVNYITDVKPLLAEKCASCHGVLKQEAGLRLDHRELIVAGGDSGAAIDMQSVPQSLLLHRIQTDDEDLRMPPSDEGSAMTPAQTNLLRRWIEQGAKAPEEEIVTSPLDHWAFQPVELSPSKRLTGDRNPIDLLLDSKHQSLGLKPVDRAERSLLIRRLYLNAIGLPPTVQQLQDSRPIEQIIDELLNSPHHGERWARHWMDVWRYSDWYGLGQQLRYSQKHMWHWRDWIVNSLNEDKGYDRMVLEMLAGDELEPENPEAVTGTGFLARNYYLFNRTTWLDQTIEHTGKAFLGLTLNCAKCHDHKYDPVSQVDYYQFRAFFEPHHIRLDPLPGVIDLEQDGLPRAFDRKLDAVTWLHRRGSPEDPDPDVVIKPAVPTVFADQQSVVSSIDLPIQAFAPGMKEGVADAIRTTLVESLEIAEQELVVAKERLNRPLSTSNVTEGNEWKFEDSFDAIDHERWEVVGDWSSDHKTVSRKSATREAEFLRLKEELPNNFELTCRYTTTGGDTYKSVTFRFDESLDRNFANLVYTSAHQQNPKVQVAEARQGKSVYPAAGKSARPIKVGQAYELKIAVRNQLVNVWLDDVFIVSYELSDRGTDRWLSLSGFDATVAFDWIRIRSLPDTVELTPASESTSTERLAPEDALRVAEAKLAWERQRLREFEVVLAADQCKARQLTGESVEGQEELIQKAALEQAQLRVMEAKWKLAQAVNDPKGKATVQQQLKTAEEKLQAVNLGKHEYLSPMFAKVALTGPDDDPKNHETMFLPTSSGRRLALARWIVSKQNPLMARVAVNHVWMRHFGEPLVESAFDFGLRAKKPVHLDVLDCLAAEFIQSGYSFRHLHRLILTSDAYQRTTSSLQADERTKQVDPGNQYLWKMNTRRMESQVVRDSLLHLAGTLNLQLGGPSVAVGPNGRRRSLYFLHSRDQHDLFLSTFDDADLLQCYRRSESVVPQQALALANSQLALTAAEQIQKRLAEGVPEANYAAFIPAAFQSLLARPADDEEHAACLEFCQQLEKLLAAEGVSKADRPSRIRIRLIDSLINHNDFISIR